MVPINKIIFIGCALLITNQSYATPKAIEFSADAVISVPQKPIKQTKLFVSDKAVRRETMVNGAPTVEIIYPGEGRAVFLNDPLKLYKERSFIKQDEATSDNNPCTQIQNSVCEKIGTENIDGINTEKWQIISNDHGRKLRTLHWIDVKRKLAIREFFPDGSVAELKMIKKEKINSRDTEKWERTLRRPNGEDYKSYQWYDTALKIAIREELPGGYLRELKNIKISKQPADLFNTPSDYKKIGNQPVMYQDFSNRRQ
ncbi:MAG: hypothetical protein OEY89_00380 [Gammaproteobacteria bacterium]|nr:hypothetical protein [Gammaproteobacteria bacterium]